MIYLQTGKTPYKKEASKMLLAAKIVFYSFWIVFTAFVGFYTYWLIDVYKSK
jgi:hypothetical protein